jgi:hypothetical protein
MRRRQAPADEGVQPQSYVFGWRAEKLPGSGPDAADSKQPQVLNVRIGNIFVELRSNPAELEHIVATAYVNGGLERMWQLREAIEAARPSYARRDPAPSPRLLLPQRPSAAYWAESAGRMRDPVERFADLFREGGNRLLTRIAAQLVEVEERAAGIVASRADAGRRRIRHEASRYLVGIDVEQVFASDQAAPAFPAQLRLASNEATMTMHTKLKDIHGLRAEAASRRQAVAQLFMHPRGRVPSERELAERYGPYAEALEQVARALAEAAPLYPILYWLEVKDPEDAEELGKSIAAELGTCWEAAAEVERRCRARPARQVLGDKTGRRRSVRQPGDGDDADETQPYEWLPPDVTASADTPISLLGDALSDREASGPWQYPLVIQTALEELGWLPPSLAARGVADVLTGAGIGEMGHELQLGLGFMAVETTLRLGARAAAAGTFGAAVAAPPLAALAAAVGIVQGVRDVMLAFDQQSREEVGSRCALLPIEGLAHPPGLNRVLQAVIANLIPPVALAAASVEFVATLRELIAILMSENEE